MLRPQKWGLVSLLSVLMVILLIVQMLKILISLSWWGLLGLGPGQGWS